MNASRSLHLKVGLLALLLLFLGAVGAGAATYNLTAEPTMLTMPDGTPVPAWGYRLSSDPVGSATVPGPEIRVPAGDSTLIINLTNALPEATSLHILGQPLTLPGGPTYLDGRVMSFVKETPNDNSTVVEYRWDNLNLGTYMLQSATNPAKQVQMGLYAAVIHDAAAGMAYDGVPYDTDRVLVFHEIDPEIHEAIDAGDYGPTGTITSSVFRHPIYYLINGAGYPQTSLDEVAAGDTVLLRFINGGLETHTPMILNKYLSVVAQDGIAKNHPQETYGFELNAAGTMDALVTIGSGETDAVYPIHDGRNRNLTNAGEQAAGGMLVHLTVGAGAPADTVTILRTRYNANSSQLRVWATSDDPAATLLVFGYPETSVTTVNFTDPNVLNGAFSRLYVAGVDANPGSVTVTSSSGGSATAAVPFTVPPQAFDDAYPVDQDQVLTVAVAGVLINDLKGGWLLNGNGWRPIAQAGPVNGALTLNTDGSFEYTPSGGFNGQDSFTYVIEAYRISDGVILASSAPATVSIFVNPVNANAAPTAVDDSYEGTEGSPVIVPGEGVLANDSDPEGSALTAILDNGPTNGTLTLNADGTFTYTPDAGSSGIDTFTYMANDGALNSDPATVTLYINDLPNANADAYATDENVDLVVAVAGGVLDNDVDTIPGDGLTAALVTTTTQGILTFSPDGSFTYAPGFNFDGVDSFTYTATDSLGATSTAATATITVNNVPDTVTITRLRWRNNQTRVNIRATSSAPAGSVTLSVTANYGTTSQPLGTLRYRSASGEYRATLSFNGAGQPDSITVTSDQGGSDTESIPYTLP